MVDYGFHVKANLRANCDVIRKLLRKRLGLVDDLKLPYTDDFDLDCWPVCSKAENSHGNTVKPVLPAVVVPK